MATSVCPMLGLLMAILAVAVAGTPTSAPTTRVITQVSVGVSKSCYLLSDNCVSCIGLSANVGQGIDGEIGDNANEMGDFLASVDITGTSGLDIMEVVSGNQHRCALMSNKRIKCFGTGSDGRLGYGDAASKGDSANEMGDFLDFVDVEGTSGLHVVQVVCGNAHTCVLLSNKRMKCFGLATDGQLGTFSVFKRSKGHTPHRMFNVQATATPLQEVMAQARWAMTLMFVDVEGTSGEHIVQIVSGSFHVCALFSNSRIKCFGRNNAGQLGYGDTTNRGTMANQMGDDLEFVDVEGTSGEHVVAVTCGNGHTCVLLSNSRIKCFGFNNNGQLGYGGTNSRGDTANEMGDSLGFVNVEGSSGFHVLEVVAAFWQTCVRLSNLQMKCFGRNHNGQLGYGDTASRGDNVGEMGNNLLFINITNAATDVVAFGMGNWHTCALLSTAQVKCWGQNSDGRSGYEEAGPLGDGPGEMGDSLPFVDVVGSSGLRVANISAGARSTCALLEDGQLKCFGLGVDIGLGDNHITGDQASELGDKLRCLDLGTGLTAVRVFAYESICVLFTNNRIKCFGTSSNGILGNGNTETLGNRVGEMGDALPFVDVEGTSGFHVLSVAPFTNHVCALLSNNRIKCWGSNVRGQLGK